MYIRRSIATTAIVLTTTFGAGTAAWANPPVGERTAGQAAQQASLPDGWELTTEGSGFRLTWHAPAPVPAGDAMVEFYAGDRPLGRPSVAPDLRSFHLKLDGLAARQLTGLQVRSSGQRIDVKPARPRSSTGGSQPAADPAVLPANQVDPGRRGPYQTTSGEYELPGVSLPGFSAPVEMKGVVVAPKGTSGQRPLVLFLHGRHSTCYSDESGASLQWPCPDGSTSIPSYHGYLKTQQLLASQGYVTVSVSANGINGQDQDWPPDDGGAQARSSLVRLHLGHWADWAGSGRASAPGVVRSAPVTDMSRVLLVGHSRGGEGVSRAALDSLSRPPSGQDGYGGQVRWQIQGMALIGPTLFGHNPPPDVPSVTILPGCDGDVSDLQGELYLDATRGVSHGTALHSAVFVVGANHNFFNTEWTPAQTATVAWDDYRGHDPVCGSGSSGRLPYDLQQTVGATYVAAAARLFVDNDDRVRPLLDGSGFRAPSTDPAQVLSHAVGGNRTPLLVPDDTVTVTGDGAQLCEQVPTDATTACGYGTSDRYPHFLPFWPIEPEPGRYALSLAWSQPGTPAAVKLAEPVSVAGSESVALRVIVPSATTGTRMEVRIVDSAGHRASLGELNLDGLQPKTVTAAGWAQEVRISLAGATSAGVDLNRVAALELVPRSGSGSAWLVDAAGWRSGTPYPEPSALPRVDLGELTVDEGDSGTRTILVPATVSGNGTGQVRVFVVDPYTQKSTSRVVTVHPGDGTIQVPISVTGNTEYGDGRGYLVAAKAVRGVAVGDIYGALFVRDDDAPA